MALTPENLRAQDIVLIVTGHRRQVDYGLVVEHAPLIVDAVNATAGLGHAEKIARVGAPLH